MGPLHEDRLPNRVGRTAPAYRYSTRGPSRKESPAKGLLVWRLSSMAFDVARLGPTITGDTAQADAVNSALPPMPAGSAGY